MYKELSAYNATANGLAVPFEAVADAVPGFALMLAFVLWFIICLGTYYTQQRRFGRGDLVASLAVGGFIACIAITLMSLIPGFIHTWEIATIVTLEIGAIMLLFTRE